MRTVAVPTAHGIGVREKINSIVFSNARTQQIYYGRLILELQLQKEMCDRLGQELVACSPISTLSRLKPSRLIDRKVMGMKRLLRMR